MIIEQAHLITLRADVANAARLIAPLWPLSSFVAVNPLRGLEHLPFEQACAEARRWFRARTHQTLAAERVNYRAGGVGDAELDTAIADHDPTLLCIPPIQLGGRFVDAVEIVRHDLLTGPVEAPRKRRNELTEATVNYVGSWCAAFVDDRAAAFALIDGDCHGLFASWRPCAPRDRRLRRLVGAAGRAWIAALPTEAGPALLAALDRLGISPAARLDVFRSLLTRLPGWAGHARWCDDWAGPDRPTNALTSFDLVAVLTVIEAAAGRAWTGPPKAVDADALLDERRVDAVLDALGASPHDFEAQQHVAAIIAAAPADERTAIWLAAREVRRRDHLLATLPPRQPVAGTERRPAVQLVHCIDVRSEPLRRHIEALGDYETFGFAGFFGMPARWRPAGSPVSHARCPVLVSPQYEVADRASVPPATTFARAIHHTADATRHGAGSAFALAETAGWVLGAIAALRTLAPPRRPRSRPTPLVQPQIRAELDERSGLPLDTRVLYAEAVLTTINLRQLAPLVVLCGHGSKTTNNPHATSLDCGACGGAPGGASARIAAAVLNDAQVRSQLSERGLDIPSDTWFIGAQHDTASDQVELLADLVPATHEQTIVGLRRHLNEAGQRVASERAARLPGDVRHVERRGSDWAETRPEWGLAGNVAFLVGPRQLTRHVNFGGRVFLHSYNAANDPDSTALETILTAPLVVAQWISAQYYFSSVDPDVFGAGDKMIHNTIADIGVSRGEPGDLAVGLPLQSVAVGDQLVHDPVRLLAIIEAPLQRVERIIMRNPVLRDLVEHEWIKIAARDHPEQPWSLRSPAGTWTTWHPAQTTSPPATRRPDEPHTRP